MLLFNDNQTAWIKTDAVTRRSVLSVIAYIILLQFKIISLINELSLKRIGSNYQLWMLFFLNNGNAL